MFQSEEIKCNIKNDNRKNCDNSSKDFNENKITKDIYKNNCGDDDIIQKIIGNFGRWQLRSVLLIFLCKIPTAWFMACIIYTAPTPKIDDYYCKLSSQSTTFVPYNNNITNNIQFSNDIKNWKRNTDREFSVNFCNIYENSKKIIQNNTKTTKIMVPCNYYEYNTEYKSLISDFNLICSRQLLIGITQCFHSLGQLLGGLLSTIALKYISPKTLMLYGMILQVLYGNLTGFLNKYELHLIFRCITSICCALMFNAGQCIFTDITSGKAKTIATTLSELFWSIGLILLPGISIFVDSWTYLYVAISTPTIILILFHRWISESPRWLIQHGNLDQALQILLESAAFNGKEIPLDIEDQLKLYADNLKKLQEPNYFSIWDGKVKKRYILAIHWAWVWSVMLYNAMILNIRSFGVDHIHSNTMVLGFAEMIGVFVGLYLILYTRRRWLWSGYLIIIAGCLAFFIWIIPDTLKENRRVGLDMIFCIGLKLANAANIAILVTCTGEMISSNKRSLLMFSTATWSRFWLLLAPFVVSTTLFHPLIPITIFAILAVIIGLFMCYLNTQFWNSNQPRIERVPTIRTFRRNSAALLTKRNSIDAETIIQSINPNTIANNSQQQLQPSLSHTASISEIWKINLEKSNSNEINEII